MSTKDLNNGNNSSQTLFRFASMRNAELSDPKNKERRFVFRSDTQKGVFDNKLNINPSTTLQKICETLSGTDLTIETEDTLKIKDSAFYELAIWIARNKSTASKAEFDAKIKEYKDYLITTKKAMFQVDSNIWDNLIYQVVTQKDFYAKETLMQFLHLHHILVIYNNESEEIYNDVIKAKVVLPKKLFKANNTVISGNANASKITDSSALNVAYNHKNMQFAEAYIELQENNDLTEALEKLKSTYNKQYQQAHKDALSSYEREVAPARKAHQNQLAELEYQKQLFIDTDNKEELAKIPYTPAPDFPEFNFEFKPEIEAATLGRTLNEQNSSALLKILGGDSIASGLENISSFEEINQLISQKNQILQQTVISNTILNQQVSTNVGGFVVPVVNSVSANAVIPFSVKTQLLPSANLHEIILVTDGLQNHMISGNYKLQDTNLTTLLSSSEVVISGQGINQLFASNPAIPTAELDNFEILKLQGTVTLQDGLSYSMYAELYIPDRVPNSEINKFRGTGTFTRIDREVPIKVEPGTTTTPTGAFIPSGFGMKNIGITDYKKVEQSTYCYVEGDVAHIENIMAREYKERSTRRLKRNESQTTKSSESEKEKLTDTTSTERHEMQSEIAKILQESKDFSAQAGFSASWGMGGNKYGLNIGASYATHNSKEESNRQAVTEAKDITARALDRIVTKVKEERIDKIIEEYEENNKHGFDNTKGSSHVVGVYRWVDKVVKNQIYNYGKRMMFEFMIPEPAKLHTLGMKISKNTENQLIKPVDPRESSVLKLENFSSLADETKLKFWLSKFNVEVDEMPLSNFSIGKSIGGQYSNNLSEIENLALKDEIQIPDGYVAISGNVQYTAASDGDGSSVSVLLGNAGFYFTGSWGQLAGRPNQTFGTPYSKIIPVSTTFYNEFSGTVNFTINLTLTQEAKNAWLQKAFNKIIEAYQVELYKYEQALADAKAMGVQIKGSNPGFYRKIENTILRRNCISYMLEQNPNVDLTFGKKRYYTNDGAAEETFTNTDIKVDGKLDQYAAFIKFMEQAFEWEIMSYHLYPYYWGERKSWTDLYQFDDNDTIFRAFMQSGMARVIVTVRPGFEEAVRHFLSTGQIWNGGEIPVIDDALFLSIVDEMRAPKGTREGEPWREKLPTALTILQAESIGLKVEKALPCNCEPGVKFDDNLGEMCGSNFELNNNQIGQNTDKWMEISFNDMDPYKTIEEMDQEDLFPRKYSCLGNDFEIDRDASWLKTDSTIKFYKALEDEISQIEGLEASVTGENGITFKINASKIKNFTFRKPGEKEEYDLLKFSIDADNSFLTIASPKFEMYGNERILDKDGQVIPKDEYLEKVPMSKFLV